MGNTRCDRKQERRGTEVDEDETENKKEVKLMKMK